MWDQEARKRYTEYANKGTETIHHARGMIVGCAGAGKTTLLKRLLRCSEAEIRNVESTVGLEVHEEVFEICNGVLKVINKNDNIDGVNVDGRESPETSAVNNYPRRITFFDFGGQCAYYACHQIYLTRRAFYILVIDASKPLDKVVDKEVCDQDGTLFSSWTYAEIERKPDILLVATHWEENEYENDTYSFLQRVGSNLPNMMSLQDCIPRDNCFSTQFPLSPLEDLEKHIISCAVDSRWSEKVPKEWLCLEVEILTFRQSKRILEFQYIVSKMPGEVKQSAKDMLRFYHDAGKVLYFNEQDLHDVVIIDVQWFVDAFKNIITDSLHTCGISKSNEDWKLYYETGHLKDTLLTEFWRIKDNELLQSLENKQKRTEDLEKDPRCIMFHKMNVLTVMQRLGLVALGKTSHYVPCMNRKPLPLKVKDMVYNAPKKTPVVSFHCCLSHWKLDNGTSISHPERIGSFKNS
ncbi:probable serine/threonine-protein kinase pats1 [Saccostrea echinata]|uniref:probable serine/threonine-protein kinase pats1 n=1 Tax=Saccostrea echinata TaxID=191078 RepID=UPI002A80A873|nr:probable serine/threonine-protein kinase pats1 [Saccostrea echinata]